MSFVFEGKCPSPLKNRDFVTMRSWLPLGNDYLIINYSVKHPVRLCLIWAGSGADVLVLWGPNQKYSTVYCVSWHVGQLPMPKVAWNWRSLGQWEKSEMTEPSNKWSRRLDLCVVINNYMSSVLGRFFCGFYIGVFFVIILNSVTSVAQTKEHASSWLL